MADNVIANTSDGLGATFGSDDIAGVQYPRTKLIIGADGVNDGDVSSANPLPVTGTVAVTNAGLTELAAAINTSMLDVNIAAQAGALTVASHAVTNAGTFAVQATVAAGATNIAKAEDAASASGDVGVPAMAIQLATPADIAGTDGDYSILQMAGGRLWTSATIDAALPAGTNAIGKLASNTGVTIGAVELAAAQTLATVTTVSAVTAVTTLTGGGVAHDGADSGNPVKIGARAVSAEITPVAANDRVDLLADLAGKLITMPYANPENFVSGCISTAMTGTTSLLLVAAPAAGLRNYITQITASCAHATQGTDILIQDGTAGTTLYVIPAAALYGGAAVTFPVPLRQPTTATGIYAANVTTGSSIKISASGYKGA